MKKTVIEDFITIVMLCIIGISVYMLKTHGYINLPWWVLLSPIWLFGSVVVLLSIIVLIYLIKSVLNG